MSHASSDNTGIYYNWYHLYDWYYSHGSWPWQGKPTTNLSTSSYSNWDNNSVLDTFMINNSNLSSYSNPSVLQTNVGTEHNVFVQGYSNLTIPDVSGSDEFVLKLKSYTDDGFQVWVDRGSGYESVISIRTNHGPRNDYGSIAVPDNTTVPIKVEWWEKGGHAILDLSWSPISGGSSYTRISQDYLTINPVFISTAVTSATEDSYYSYKAVASNVHESSSHQTMSTIVVPSFFKS